MCLTLDLHMLFEQVEELLIHLALRWDFVESEGDIPLTVWVDLLEALISLLAIFTDFLPHRFDSLSRSVSEHLPRAVESLLSASAKRSGPKFASWLPHFLAIKGLDSICRLRLRFVCPFCSHFFSISKYSLCCTFYIYFFSISLFILIFCFLSTFRLLVVITV